MQDKKINFSISDGEEFFAHEVTINFNPTQFIFDFKCVTPRSDPRNTQGPTLTIKHNVVLFDAYHAKKFQELLGGVLSKYEGEFGDIKKPKAIEIAEDKKKDVPKKGKGMVPDYFG